MYAVIRSGSAMRTGKRYDECQSVVIWRSWGEPAASTRSLSRPRASGVYWVRLPFQSVLEVRNPVLVSNVWLLGPQAGQASPLIDVVYFTPRMDSKLYVRVAVTVGVT